MTFKKILGIILIGFLLWEIETVYGCEPDPVRNFMSGSYFVIGEVIAIDATEILLNVNDYFISESTTSEALEVTSETVSVSNNARRMQQFEQGDYVIAAFSVSGCYWDNDDEIFHVTSLDYATLQVEVRMGQGRGLAEKMLTGFVNHRATYDYQQRGTRIYRRHRRNLAGWISVNDSSSLIIGKIIALEWGEVTIEVWDYVTPYGIELAFDSLVLYWGNSSVLNDFNVGDDVAVSVQVPMGGGDANTLTAMPTRISSSMDVLSVDNLDNGVQLESVLEDDSLSAFYTDLLQHRGSYSYVVTFGGPSRYRSVARFMDGELIMIYEEEKVLKEKGEYASEADNEPFTSSGTMGSNLLVLTFASVGVTAVILVVKIGKRVLKYEK